MSVKNTYHACMINAAPSTIISHSYDTPTKMIEYILTKLLLLETKARTTMYEIHANMGHLWVYNRVATLYRFLFFLTFCLFQHFS